MRCARAATPAHRRGAAARARRRRARWCASTSTGRSRRRAACRRRRALQRGGHRPTARASSGHARHMPEPAVDDASTQPGDEGAVAAHARRQHVGARRGRQRREQHHASCAAPAAAERRRPAPSATAGSTTWRIARKRGGQARRRRQAAELHAGADRHQAERQRGRADALQRRGHRRPGSCRPSEVGQPARRRVPMISGLRSSSRPKRVAAMARQRPHRGDVAQRHAHARSAPPSRPRPARPPSRSASASAMKELKRKADLRAGRRARARRRRASAGSA